MSTRYNLNELPSTFDQYKDYIAQNEYNPDLEGIWQDYNYGKVFDSDSEMVKSSVAFNTMPEAYEYTRNSNSHVIGYPSVAGRNVVLSERLVETTSRQARMVGTDPSTMQGVNYLHDVNAWIPDEAVEVEVKSWDDVFLYVPSSGNYIYFASCLGKYSGYGHTHATVGRATSRMDWDDPSNYLYQQNRLIAVPLRPNKTYYCASLYPIVGEYDTSLGKFNKGVTTVSTSTPYAPTYGEISGSVQSNKITVFKTLPSWTVPAQNRSTRVTVSTSARKTLNCSTATGREPNANRVSDLAPVTEPSEIYTSFIGELGSTYVRDGVNYGVPTGGGFTRSYACTPALYTFKTLTGITSGSYLFINTCKYTGDGQTFSPVPRVWEV